VEEATASPMLPRDVGLAEDEYRGTVALDASGEAVWWPSEGSKGRREPPWRWLAKRLYGHHTTVDHLKPHLVAMQQRHAEQAAAFCCIDENLALVTVP